VADDALEKLGEQLPTRQTKGPPLHLWQPPLSGDIDIVIQRDGRWFHEGGLIQRKALLGLFASILRREADGEYYLVTPVEKWRIRVESLPLLIVDFDIEAAGCADQCLRVTTNTGQRYSVGSDYPLHFPGPDADEAIPAIGLDNGLAARFTRAAWYRLVEAAEERQGVVGIESGGQFFPLQAA
jgi:hypothetical protein